MQTTGLPSHIRRPVGFHSHNKTLTHTCRFLNPFARKGRQGARPPSHGNKSGSRLYFAVGSDSFHWLPTRRHKCRVLPPHTQSARLKTANIIRGSSSEPRQTHTFTIIRHSLQSIAHAHSFTLVTLVPVLFIAYFAHPCFGLPLSFLPLAIFLRFYDVPIPSLHFLGTHMLRKL